MTNLQLDDLHSCAENWLWIWFKRTNFTLFSAKFSQSKFKIYQNFSVDGECDHQELVETELIGTQPSVNSSEAAIEYAVSTDLSK